MIRKLDNGIIVRSCFLKNSNSVCLILKLNIGSAWEKQNRRGITHLVEHLCFRRHKGISQSDFYYKIEKIGGHLRGITYRDCVLFEITVLRKHLFEAIDILRGLFDENRWTYEDIRKEKQVVLRQIEDSGEWKHKQLIYDFFCKAPAGEYIHGTENKVMSCTKNNINIWKNTIFNTNLAEIIVVGNIIEKDMSHICDIFSDIPKSSSILLSEIKPKRFLSRNKCDTYFYEDGEESAALSLAFDIDTEHIQKRYMNILHNALCCGLLSPFTMRLREEKGLLDQITSGCDFYSFGGVLYFIFEVEQKNFELLSSSVSDLFVDQIKNLDKRAFECAKAAFTDRAEALLFTPCEFAYFLAFNGEISSPEQYLDEYVSVEYDAVCEIAANVLKKENVTINIYNKE